MKEFLPQIYKSDLSNLGLVPLIDVILLSVCVFIFMNHIARLRHDNGGLG
jgi:biopolymer transport protein ExbD